MKIEIKLVPLDRKTGRPALSNGSVNVPVAFVLDTDALNGAFAAVPKHANGVDVEVFAGVLGEMFGADVYYRPLESTDGIKAEWKREPATLPISPKYAQRRAVKLHAQKIAEVLESIDNRCMAADGPVTPTRDEITGDELRDLYVAATRIVEAYK